LNTSIPQPPTCFNIEPFGQQWFRWKDASTCFWPAKGQRAEKVNLQLSKVRYCGGVYLLAWAKAPPLAVKPAEKAVQYIGETGETRGMRHWMEAVAQEEYRAAHGHLPLVNRVEEGEVDFSSLIVLGSS
jgi:hypothetical protein